MTGFWRCTCGRLNRVADVRCTECRRRRVRIAPARPTDPRVRPPGGIPANRPPPRQEKPPL